MRSPRAVPEVAASIPVQRLETQQTLWALNNQKPFDEEGWVEDNERAVSIVQVCSIFRVLSFGRENVRDCMVLGVLTALF